MSTTVQTAGKLLNAASGDFLSLIRRRLPDKTSRFDRVLRLVCLFLLRGLTMGAAIGAVYFAWIWWLTAVACWKVFFVHTASAALLEANAANSLQDQLVSLDLSTASAFMLLHLCTIVSSRGYYHGFVRPHRDGASFYKHGYDDGSMRLLPFGTDVFYIRGGLIGTLASFVMAALVLLPQMTPTDEKSGNTNAIFLLLCASLLSTFVGVVLAYMVMPLLERINDRALGLHMLAPLNTLESETDRLTARLESAENSLNRFELATSALTQVLDGITHFAETTHRVANGFETVSTTLKDVTSQMTTIQGQLGSICTRVDKAITELETRSPELFKNFNTIASDISPLLANATSCFQCFQSIVNQLQQPAALAGEILKKEVIETLTNRSAVVTKLQTRQAASVERLAKTFLELKISLTEQGTQLQTEYEKTQKQLGTVIASVSQETANRVSKQLTALESQLSQLTDSQNSMEGRVNRLTEQVTTPISWAVLPRVSFRSRWNRMLRRISDWFGWDN